MKYFVYSYLWTTPQTSRLNFGTGVSAHPNGIVGLYEKILRQPEDWCLTHVAEITKEEYEAAVRTGLIG